MPDVKVNKELLDKVVEYIKEFEYESWMECDDNSNHIYSIALELERQMNKE